MDQGLFDYVTERVDVLAASDLSRRETKDAARAWKAAAADDADAATGALLDFLEGRMTPIDDLIVFLEGPAVDILGADAAAEKLAVTLRRKERGLRYCDCEAHTAAGEILEKFGRIRLHG